MNTIIDMNSEYRTFFIAVTGK